MSHVLQYCRNVEEIEFRRCNAALTRWGTAFFFREYGARLRRIEWDCEKDEKGFSGLQKCVNLRRVKLNNLNAATLNSILKASALTLEELCISITPIGDSVEVVEAIRNNCKCLSVLYVRTLKDVIKAVGQASYSSLLCSYGAQLKSAEVCGLSHEHLAQLVKTCTNLEVTVYWASEANTDWQSVGNLGPRVSDLILDAKHLHGKDYPRALAQCSNLRGLDMAGNFGSVSTSVTDEMIASVFSPSRFPKLDYLIIPNFHASERNMALIASSTTNLKSARFLSLECDSKASVLQVFADSNKRLNRIRIEM